MRTGDLMNAELSLADGPGERIIEVLLTQPIPRKARW
jgi:hypothetical protein